MQADIFMQRLGFLYPSMIVFPYRFIQQSNIELLGDLWKGFSRSAF